MSTATPDRRRMGSVAASPSSSGGIAAVLVGLASTLLLACAEIQPGAAPPPPQSHPALRASVEPASLRLEKGQLFANIFFNESVDHRALSYRLEGPGASTTSPDLYCIGGRAGMRCTGVKVELSSDIDMGTVEEWPRKGGGWDLDMAALTEGPYRIVVSFEGRAIGGAELRLARMPAIGGAREWTVDPASNGKGVYVLPDGTATLSFPVTARYAGKRPGQGRALLLAFYRGERRAKQMLLKLPGPDLQQGRLLEMRAIPLPRFDDGAEGPLSLVVVDEARKVLDGWRWDPATCGDVARSSPEAPCQGFAAAWTPPPAIARDAQSLLRPSPVYPRPAPETHVCVLYLDPRGREIVDARAKLREQWWQALGSASASYTSSYGRAEGNAARQGREVTQAERDAAGRRGDHRARGAEDARFGVEARERKLAQRVAGLASKYKPGCLGEALPETARTLLR
jgi:hypothetical protein